MWTNHSISIKRLQFLALIILISTFYSCKKDGKIIDPPTQKKISLDSLKTLATNIPRAIYADLTFVNSNIGFAIAQNLIVKTTDGGKQWTSTPTPIEATLEEIQFVDFQTGYIIGNQNDKGVLFKTINGGQTWTNMNINSPENLNGMHFITHQIGFVVGENFFSRTTDGGQTWTSLKGQNDQLFNDIQFKNKSEGIVSAGFGIYYKTINGGDSWTTFETKYKVNLTDIYFTDKETFLRVAADKLLDIRNNETITNVPYSAYKFFFLNPTQAIGIGSHYEVGFWPYGDIFITNDKWKTHHSKKYQQSEAISFTAIAQMDKDRIMILGIGLEEPKVLILNK